MTAVPQIGDRLAQYEILSPIGAGGMGRVYRARDTRLDREVALKVLAPDRADDPEMRARFHREARAIAALNHPGIVAVYEMGAPGNQPFIVMELLEGQNLRALVGAAPLQADQIVDIGVQLTSALAAAHAKGIVHRDLKPENVFLTDSGSVKILDFGLARGSIESDATGEASLTQSNVILGSVRYMSPEQARGDTLSVASDVFAAGILLYELTTGRHPFEGNSMIAVLQAVVEGSPLSPSVLNPAVSTALETLILEMLGKDPDGRPGANEIATRLRGMTPGAFPAATVPISPTPGAHIVGRASEREAIVAAWSAACAGRSSLIAIAGEPGIGKTTIVNDALGEIGQSGAPCLSGQGRCSESLALTEAYLPVLEALEGLLRAGGGPIQRALKQLAPTWHLQVAPLLLRDSSAERMRHELRSASEHRMKREIRAFLREVSRRAGVILFLDDMHWADPATVDLLAYLAGNLEDMRLLIVTTHRISELLLTGHPFGPLLLDLQARSIAQYRALPFLDRTDVDRYLGLEFPAHAFPPDFCELVHSRTEGSPLFMVAMLADLRDRGLIVRDGSWRLAEDLPSVQRELPPSVRSMVQRRLDRVAEADLRLLRAASLQGHRFDAVVVAEAAERTAEEVEERLDALERMHGLVRLVEERELPDGTMTSRYQFVHVLYQDALHGSLTAARRAALSASVARSLQSHHAKQPGPMSSRIAYLFESAREFQAAAAAYAAAADHTAQMLAHREAATLARRGLAMLAHLPDTRDRDGLELTLLVTLGGSLLVTDGYTAEDVKRTYVRARELCAALGDRPEWFPVLWGLWSYHECIGEHRTAAELAAELVRMAEHRRPADRARAGWALGTTTVFLGDPAGALGHLAWGLEYYREEDDRPDRHLYGHDAGISCQCFIAWALTLIGRHGEALGAIEQVRERAAGLGHAQSLAFATLFSSMVYQACGEGERALAGATAAVEIAEREGLPLYREWSAGVRGWALATLGRTDEGLALVSGAIAALRALGSHIALPYFMLLHADALAATQSDRAIDVLHDALRQSEASGERHYRAEILRFEAEIRARLNDVPAAVALATQAVEVAAEQGALGLMDRASATLERLTVEGVGIGGED